MMPKRLLKRSLKLEALWAGTTGTRRLGAMPCSSVTVDGRTFATPLEAAMHLLWLIQRLSYCEPHRDGMPADGPRLRETIRESVGSDRQ